MNNKDWFDLIWFCGSSNQFNCWPTAACSHEVFSFTTEQVVSVPQRRVCQLPLITLSVFFVLFFSISNLSRLNMNRSLYSPSPLPPPPPPPHPPSPLLWEGKTTFLRETERERIVKWSSTTSPTTPGCSSHTEQSHFSIIGKDSAGLTEFSPPKQHLSLLLSVTHCVLPIHAV